MKQIATIAFAAILPIAPVHADMRIVTDMELVASLVEQVAGDNGTVVSLMPRTADPHHYQLTPSQAKLAQDADVILWVGEALTPQISRVIDGMGKTDVAFEVFGNEAEDMHDHDDHNDDATHEDHDEHEDHDGHEDHDHGAVHPWLNPDMTLVAAERIADVLATTDPVHADAYHSNADALAADLEGTFAEIQARLSSVADVPFLTGHDAYGAFADHFGLSNKGHIAGSEHQKPGAAKLAELRDAASAGDFVCVFSDAGHDAKALDVIADGTPVRKGVLDPTGSLLEDGPELYQRMMRALADDVFACLDEGA